ncbi:MAG: peptidoglycan editing factor PgeF [Magnetococcales bacterium]|nr:peptidoglycan editing factor PgeF [Magnetococcales bacterium]
MQSQDSPVFLSLPGTIAPVGIWPFFTTRRGGVSRGGHAGWNLALHVNDDLDLVQNNRALLQRSLPSQVHALCLVNQVHGVRTVVASPGQRPPEADALVTDEPGVAIAIMTADCAPVLLYDPVRKIIGAAHAGWRGALSGIIESCIDLMETMGANSLHMKAIIGPTIRPPYYEVDQTFYDQFINYHNSEQGIIVEKFFLSLATRGRFQFNLPNYIKARLCERGVPQGGITDVGMCTFQNEELFFSHRRSTRKGETSCGRQMGGIVLV